jgi:phage baseplate assembly protein W
MAVSTRARKRKTPTRSKKRASAIDALRPAEALEILRALLVRHPELGAEVAWMVDTTITRASAEDVADRVEEAILALDIDAQLLVSDEIHAEIVA